MNNSEKKESGLNKNSESKFIVNIYGFLAVIFVIIPEWIAELGISLESLNLEDKLPDRTFRGLDNSYFYISELIMKELRIAAAKLRVFGYSTDNKEILRKRVLKKIKRIGSMRVLRENQNSS